MGRAARRKDRPSPAAASSTTPVGRAARARHLGTALGLFLLALAVRIAFWRSTPGASWPYSPYFKGDAVVWLDYARALQLGQPFELGLPIHPPGAGYLLSWIWDGTAGGVERLRLIWCLLGSLVPTLVYLAASRSFGYVVAAVAGGGCAVSTGLMILSTSLNNETPYLVLVAASLLLLAVIAESPPGRPPLLALAAWSALHGLACLLRVEHVVYYAPLLLYLAWSWRRGRSALRALAVSLAAFATMLLPWHVKAWRAIERVNAEPPADLASRAAVEYVERRLGGIEWDAEARTRRDALPAFARANASAFVAATVAHRGGRMVHGDDFAVLEEAFGYEPRPLARFPFVSLYGPLNFALANHPGAGGGFSPEPLAAPPRAASEPGRYPADLIAGLPPPQLALAYPPHLRLVNQGYALGWRWIVQDPAGALRRLGRKLAIFWSGATLGVTGYGLPLGVGGVRRAVDLVVPEGALAVVWRVAVLLLVLAGLRAGWGHRALVPWLLFAASKVLAVVLFFGYARQGATVIPVVALLVALAVRRALPARPRRLRTVGVAVVVIALGLEAWRFGHPPSLWIDGRSVGTVDPVPLDIHRDQRVGVGAP